MAKETTSVRMQAQIKIMSAQGHSLRSIARVLKLSRRTVRKYLEPAAQPPSANSGWEQKIDWDYVRQEVYGKGTTVKQIGQEVAPNIAYVKFWRVFREQAGLKASPEQVTVRLNHKPAEKTQVDFCDGVFITERESGNKTLAQFFLGVLPFSSYTFGEFVLDQKPLSATFIGVQQRMFAYFGGVTPYLASLPYKNIAIILVVVTLTYFFIGRRFLQTTSVNTDSQTLNLGRSHFASKDREDNINPKVSDRRTHQTVQQEPPRPTSQAISQRPYNIGSGNFTVGSTRDKVIAIQGTPDRVTNSSVHFGTSDVHFDHLGHVIGWFNGKPKLRVALTSSMRTLNEFFTVGSSKDDVIAIQGTPARLTKNAYHYGTSEVLFENDRVIGWHNFYPKLKVQLLPSKPVTEHHFTVGSTMDEVLSMQGTPDRVTKTSLRYGTSDIQFDQGRVTEWYNGVPKLKKSQQAQSNRSSGD